MRKVFLDDLPRKEGFGINKGKMLIDWNDSIGCKIPFIYDDIVSEVEILDYVSKGQKLIIKYNNRMFWEKPISTGNFQKCRLGFYLNKRTGDFKINLNEIFKDDKRDLIIIDREYRKDRNGVNKKWYKYKCNKCGNEDWIIEHSLCTQGSGCNVCNASNPKAKEGINTIWDTDRWMCYLGVSEEDAKTHTPQSNQKIEVICPDCGKIKLIALNTIYNNKTIYCSCKDGFSYPEKFLIEVLKDIEVKFQTQLNKTTFKWCDKYKYDFYIPEYKMIIETHGLQHYEDKTKNSKFKRTLFEEQENDRCKEQLAKENGIEHYVVIDCRYSELEWIKNNILNSKLNVLFDLSQVDWLKCEEFALKNIVREVCEYWNNKRDEETTKDLAEIYNIHQTTIINYLKKGTELGWCRYNAEEEFKSSFKTMKILRSKKTKCLNDGNIFSSTREAGRYYGINSSSISAVCLGKRRTAGGKIFCYI